MSVLEKLKYVITPIIYYKSMHGFHVQKISKSGMLCEKIMIFGKGSTPMTALILP